MSGVIHKRLETANKKPTAAEIGVSEIAINLVDKTLWTKDHTGTVVSVGGGTVDTYSRAEIDLKDSEKVSKTGNETVAGVKTFSSSPIVPTPTTGFQVATKEYVDATVNNITPPSAYSVRWDSNTDSYTRLGNTDSTQIQRLMKRCVLNTNGTVNYYLDPLDSTKKEDGTVVDLTGADGNVMVQIPKFYYSDEQVEGIRTSTVSLLPEDGLIIHPAFNRGGVEVDFRYYRAYEGYLNGTKLISRSGVTPTISRSIVQFRADALANGTGWSQTDWNLLYAVQLLFLTEFATFDTQSVLGNGNDTESDYGIVTGGTNSLGNRSSSPESDNTYMSYRGIENWYGDIWEFIDGINISERVPFVNDALPSTYTSDVYTGDYVTTGVTMPVASGSYIKNWHTSNKGFIASTVGGASSTYITDGLWTNTGSRVVRFGGSASNGLLDGGFYCSASSDSAHVDVGIGSGVSF